MPHTSCHKKLTEDSKLILPEDFAKKLLQHIHQTINLGTKKKKSYSHADLKIIHRNPLVK